MGQMNTRRRIERRGGKRGKRGKRMRAGTGASHQDGKLYTLLSCDYECDFQDE